MEGDGYFDEDVAAGYDDDADDMSTTAKVDPVVDFLADLARGGSALEFGIGTGRIALPLSGKGVPVVGVDMSRPMVRRLRSKPGGHAIDVVIGDFATTRVDGSFELVYLVFNTIMNLTTQTDQVACFRNAAAHLASGGKFVVEVMVPELRRLPPGQTGVVFRSDGSGWGIDEYDVVSQGMVSHHLDVVGEVVTCFSIPFRYVWPSELDLMAEMAGMRLIERWDDWDRRPFTGESQNHVSVWVKPAD